MDTNLTNDAKSFPSVWIPRYDEENEVQTKIEITAEHTEDDPLTFEGGGPTDEGHHSYREEFWLENGIAIVCSMTDATDCDGRLSTENKYEWDGKAWNRISGSQRDYSAEAMGY